MLQGILGFNPLSSPASLMHDQLFFQSTLAGTQNANIASAQAYALANWARQYSPPIPEVAEWQRGWLDPQSEWDKIP